MPREDSADEPSFTRVLVYGVTGSGKTQLAKRLANATGLPFHSADDEIGWLPNWTERPHDEQREIASAIAESDRWVLDTAYGHWRELVLPRAELIVALDYPRPVSLTRLLRRTAKRVSTREQICNANTESLRRTLSSDSIILWHFRSFARKRRQIQEWLVDPLTPPVIRLTSPSETERWMQTLTITSGNAVTGIRHPG